MVPTMHVGQRRIYLGLELRKTRIYGGFMEKGRFRIFDAQKTCKGRNFRYTAPNRVIPSRGEISRPEIQFGLKNHSI